MTLDEFIEEKRKKNEADIASFKEYWNGLTPDELRKGTKPINYHDWNYEMDCWLD